jgi:DNA-binding Lrp family transcriptional regulator
LWEPGTDSIASVKTEPTEGDRRLLNAAQKELALVPRPFALLAEELGTTEDQVLERLAYWRDTERVIRQISAIFDTRKLGYRSMLVAMKIPPERITEAGELVNAHPGVSHNYERAHDFNLWFTIAVPPGMDLEDHVQRLHDLTGATSTRMLPTVKMFKIEVRLDMEKGVSNADGPPPPKVDLPPLDDTDIRAIRALQVDMPLVSRPFAAEADTVGMTEAELLEAGRHLLAQGRMRRCAAILRHREAGFLANGMGVWKTTEVEAESFGYRIAAHPAVTHCYQRPAYDDWPYRVFSMVHARTEEQVREIIEGISQDTGLREYDVLFSTREFKKTRVPYFTDTYADWESRYLTTAV